jgi:hypothetical protein
MATSEGYRHTLEAYTGPATRYTCPSCGHRRAFTRYMDTATGEHLAEHVGKCDRVDKCGHHVTPSQYFAAGGVRPAGDWTPPPIPPELPGYRMSRAEVRATMGHEGGCNLLEYLGTVLDPEQVKRTAWEYCVGTWTAPGKYHGAAVFWQVDRSGAIRGGKVRQFDANGRGTATLWVHSLCGGIPDGYRLDQCLFGEHLLDKYPEAPVGIVEAEKTALIARLYVPDVLWIATGGKDELKLSKVLPLAGRNVTLWPDLGKGFATWSAKAPELDPLFASLVVVDLRTLANITPEEEAQGLDLADYFPRLGDGTTKEEQPARMPSPSPMARKVQAFIQRHRLELLAEELDLDISRARIYSTNT